MKLPSSIIASALAAIMLAQACTPAKKLTADTSVKDALDSLVEAYFPGHNAPGAFVMVVRDDSTVYTKAQGLARLDSAFAISDTTAFNICSVSKQFSAVALLKLAQDGQLSLSDKVSDYFPDFKAPFFKDITLAHLLSHTSGLPDLRPRNHEQWVEYLKDNASIFGSSRDFRLYCPEEESIRFYEKLDSINFAPGTGYDYQNPTYQLVYYIVEHVTGTKFDEWMTENIFRPAGMEHTVYFEPERHIKNMAHAYRQNADNGKWEEYDYGEANFFGTKADGGIYTTARDFALWQKALFGGKIIADSTLQSAITPYISTPEPHTGYGYGLYIENRPDRPEKIYHTGDNGAFYIFEGEFPEKKLFYLIFANRDDWNREELVEKFDSVFTAARWL